MTPEFAKAVDQIFVYTIDVVQKIERGENIKPELVKNQIHDRIDEAGDFLGATDEWDLAKYALCAWVDELMSTAEYPGAKWWSENPVERYYFPLQKPKDDSSLKAVGNRVAALKFFQNAVEATNYQNPREVYFICVILGFRGFYGSSEASQIASKEGLPPTLDKWLSQYGRSIQTGDNRPLIDERARIGGGATPNVGRQSLATMVLFGVASLAALIGFSIYHFGTAKATSPVNDSTEKTQPDESTDDQDPSVKKDSQQ